MVKFARSPRTDSPGAPTFRIRVAVAGVCRLSGVRGTIRVPRPPFLRHAHVPHQASPCIRGGGQHLRCQSTSWQNTRIMKVHTILNIRVKKRLLRILSERIAQLASNLRIQFVSYCTFGASVTRAETPYFNNIGKHAHPPPVRQARPAREDGVVHTPPWLPRPATDLRELRKTLRARTRCRG